MKTMNKVVIVLATFMSLTVSSSYAEGCLKGAAVGGIAGHFLGKHPILGAGAGCLTGEYINRKKVEPVKVPANTANAISQTNGKNNSNTNVSNYNQSNTFK